MTFTHTPPPLSPSPPNQPVVLVGFELSSYSVMEGDSRLEVCVEILDGLNLYELARPVSVRVSSGDGSAIGQSASRQTLLP